MNSEIWLLNLFTLSMVLAKNAAENVLHLSYGTKKGVPLSNSKMWIVVSSHLLR